MATSLLLRQQLSPFGGGSPWLREAGGHPGRISKHSSNRMWRSGVSVEVTSLCHGAAGTSNGGQHRKVHAKVAPTKAKTTTPPRRRTT